MTSLQKKVSTQKDLAILRATNLVHKKSANKIEEKHHHVFNSSFPADG